MADLKQEPTDLTLPQDKLIGIYRGVVEDNSTDPLKMGRCKIRVFGVHTKVKTPTLTEGIPTNQLPWAEPAMPAFGGISKVGIFGVPEQGAHVFLFFENGHIMNPRYFATVPGLPASAAQISDGFNDPAGIFPRTTGLPDWNAGEENLEAEYPKNLVFYDRTGNKIEFDFNTDKEKIIIQHGRTKTILTFTAAGGITWDIKEKTLVQTKETATFVSGEDTLIKSSKENVKLEATLKNIQMQAKMGLTTNSETIDMVASMTASFKGSNTTTVGGGTITNVNSDALTKITGGVIMIG